jgi:hypothetical protein
MSLTNSDEPTSDAMKIVPRLKEVFGSQPGFEFTFNSLFDAVKPHNEKQLALALASLVDQGVIRKFVRVQSPTTHGGLGDFPSVIDVPDEIHDIHADSWVQVRPEHLVVIYRAA